MSLIAFEYLKQKGFDLIDDAEARVVLFCLFDYADRRGLRMFPSVERIAAECRRPPDLVEEAIQAAIAAGLIRVAAISAAGRRVFATADDLATWACAKPVENPCGKPVENGVEKRKNSTPFRSVSDPSVRTRSGSDPGGASRAVLEEAEAARRRLLLEAYSGELLDELIRSCKMAKASSSPSSLRTRRRRSS